MSLAPDSERKVVSSPPERLGIYRIESRLGRGGMGEVYLAWDEVLERHVAIKRVLGERLGDEVHRARFLREARAVARLDHPAIVRVHHVLERDGDPCLVMEFVRGQDFSKLPAGGLPVTRVVSLAVGVAEGLEAAHAEGLVHRDLKLANLMATADGRVKILDFGLAVVRAQEAEADEEADSLTGSGVLVGTVHAMSPEQATSGKVDSRSDLFSLGSVIYELLTGVSPFTGNSMLDTLRRVVTVPAEPIEQVAPKTPPELARLVHELLEKDREQRPATARVVAARLSSLLRRLSDGPDLRSPRGAVAETAAIGSASGDAAGLASADPEMPTAAIPFARAAVDVTAEALATPPSGLVLRTVVFVERTERAEAERAIVESEADLDELTFVLAARFDGLRSGEESASAGVPVFLFFRPAEAVAFALALHDETARESRPLRIGIHLGEVALGPAAAPQPEVDAFEAASRLMRLARPRQILVGRSAFDLARRARAPESLAEPGVRWLAHGGYVFGTADEPYEVFEVGRDGIAPLRRPDDGEAMLRSVGATEEVALGWRPATGQPVPRRPNWRLVERLGEGGFGEVWLARNEKTGGAAVGEVGAERVFKFSFEPERLRALKREVTLFRLLRETLGHRDDIARVLDWDFQEMPYFLESEYTASGDLTRWAERRGGLAEVPMGLRLELVAQAADALAAAHSVGVLHKDVKPANVLVGHDDDGRPQARLTDFGIGLLTDRSRLHQPGFTVLGFTEATVGDSSSAGGTVQYMAPELLEGKPATTQADVYSLGVLLYQIVVGDFERALATGWQRDIGDPLLVDDIAVCVDGAPDRRLKSLEELAERLRSLDERRASLQEAQEAEAAEKRSRRRRRIAGWLGAFAAVLLLVVSVFAYQTNRAREQAEQRRRQAENLIDFLLGDLRAELQPIGKLDILDQVGDEAMEYFSAVAEEQLSPEELANYSKALHQIGQVRFALGKIPEATEAFGESLTMAKRLAASDPQNADWQFQLGQSHFWLGYLRWEERDLAAATQQFEDYREISEKLVARDPANADWQLELAYSWSNLGQVLEESGKLEESAAALRASSEMFESILLGRPDDVDLAVERAHVEAKLGQTLWRWGEPTAARERFELALRIYQQASEGRDSALYRHHAGTMLQHLASLDLELGEPEKALSEAEAGLSIARDLVTHDARNLVWQETLANRLSVAARILGALGRRVEARRALEEEQTLAEGLAEPGQHARWMLTRARNHCSWSDFHLRASPEDPAEDLAAFEQAERCRESLAGLVEQADGIVYRYWWVQSHLLLGEASLRLGWQDRANRTWASGIAEWERNFDAAPRARDLDLRVRLLLAAGRLEEAEPWIGELRSRGYREPTYLRFLAARGLSGP